MGVSGSGKSTVAGILADRLGYRFLEGDDLHSAANVAKMTSGIPLDDADRLPWLHAITGAMRQRPSEEEGVVVACSALARRYRDVLRDGDASTFFVFLDADTDVLRARVAARRDSFVPASLLDSQLAALEPLQGDEVGVRVDADQSPDAVVDQVLGVWTLRPPDPAP
jgi:gluconokinase